MKKKFLVKNVTALMILMSCLTLSGCNKGNSNNSSTNNSGTSENVDKLRQYVKSINIKSYPSKTDYVVDERIDLKGLVFDATWSVYGEETLIEDMTYQDLDSYTKVATKGLKEVTCIIGDYTFTLPITVIDILDVYSEIVIERKDGSSSLEVAKDTVFTNSFKVIAKGKDGSADKLLTEDDYEISAKFNDELDETLNINNLFSKIGKVEFTIKFSSLSVTATYTVIDGYTIYANNIIETKNIKEDTRNFLEKRVEIFDDPEKTDPTSKIRVATDAGVSYCGEINQGANLYFHVWSDYEKEADIVLYASSTEKVCTELGYWTPTETRDQQFNTIFDVTYEDETIVISDDVILPGCESKITTGDGPFDSKGRAYDDSIWVNWQAVNFGNIKLKKGDNVIKLSNKKGNVCNVYALEVKFKGE